MTDQRHPERHTDTEDRLIEIHARRIADLQAVMLLAGCGVPILKDAVPIELTPVPRDF